MRAVKEETECLRFTPLDRTWRSRLRNGVDAANKSHRSHPRCEYDQTEPRSGAQKIAPGKRRRCELMSSEPRSGVQKVAPGKRSAARGGQYPRDHAPAGATEYLQSKLPLSPLP